tara:strand:+ start:401 stop:1156 length:756 start_codon:yes stop_codon:yes gene_type:complete
MPTPKTVSQIKNDLLSPALTSHFEVEIGIPDDLRSYLGFSRQGKLNLLCSEVDLPGSQMITHDVNNDFTGVREKHAYRRVFEEQTNFTFYVDSGDYTPIRFFESWLEFISNGRQISPRDNPTQLKLENYFYRMRYPDSYTAAGLKIIKFEKDYRRTLEYEFVKSFPLAITSMPVSYDGSDLLKCTVSMTYMRYVVTNLDWPQSFPSIPQISGIIDQANRNTGGFAGLVLDRVGAALPRGARNVVGALSNFL